MSEPQVVLITGASAGIGAALARAWAKRGAKLALCARGEADLRALERELRGRNADVFCVPCDVTQPLERRALLERTVERFGRLDVLVNNAGRGMRGAVCELPAEDLAALYALNVIAPVALTQLALPALRRTRGAVVMMSSVAGVVAMPELGGYASSKFALEGLSMALRAELAQDGVGVLVVRPGPVDTQFRANAFRYGDDGSYQPRGDSAQSADDVAAQTLQAVERREAVLETSLMVRGASVVTRAAPGVLRWAQRVIAGRRLR